MKLIICILVFLSSVTSFSQENDLGPNGGQLKSVGEFYSEVLTNKDGSFDVYLLDKETKKPSVRYSYVTGFFESNGGTKVEILCVAQKTYFECYPRGLNIKKGKKLSLSMARENVTGNDVVYTLPIFNPKDLASAQGRIAYALKLDKDQKYMSFRSGKRSYETSTQLEAGGSYCVIENLKLQKVTIKPKKKFTTKIEKIDFPNKAVQRYSVIENRDYNLYCDFTADTEFKQSLAIEKINQHLNGWLKFK